MKTKKAMAFVLSLVIIICASAFSVYAGDFDTDIIPIKPTSATAPSAESTTRSGDDFNTSTIPVCLAHSWDTGKVIKPATASANGSILYTCKNCGNTDEKIIYRIASVALSAAKYTYNGKVKSPSVVVKNSEGKVISSKYYKVTKPSGRKNVGKYTYKIVFNTRYKYSKSLSITINPVATSITKLQTTKGRLTATWAKKTTQVTGYQLQYATNSKFAKASTVSVSSCKATSKAVSGLKSGKKYYVRIRTYKTVSGTKYYSSWSKAKSVIIK